GLQRSNRDTGRCMDAPELVLANARVQTMDPLRPLARSVGLVGGRIAVVSDRAVPAGPRWRGVPQFDCGGRTLLPGFIDPHCHLLAYARSLTTLDVGPSRVRSIAQLQAAVADAAQALPEGAWVKGRGYDEFQLAEGRHPTRLELDAVSPHHPVRLEHRSGHAHLLNSAALARAAALLEQGDPVDGLIDRDPASGEPTGLLFGMHRQLAGIVPAWDADEADRALDCAEHALLSFGVTCVHDTSPGNGLKRLEMFRRRRASVRVAMALGWDAFEEIGEGWQSLCRSDGAVPVLGVKLTIHEVTGRLNPSLPELRERVLRIHSAGAQVLMHAVEPAAIEAACAAVEFAQRRLPRADHRHRIEHASVCPPALAGRVAAAGITVVAQPTFIEASGERYLATVAPCDIGHLVPLATFLRCGVHVAASSDAPVASPDPLIGLRAAVTRLSRQGAPVAPHQAIAPVDALGLFTRQAARAMRAEDERGTLRAGASADLVLLSSNPLDGLQRDLRVDLTLVGGEMVYTRN
ncbi:MAG: amidohydrolase family protein, partial [Ramlibacter sp.]|nr:amidohydrolase family protein [Ramlibacter sp.]